MEKNVNGRNIFGVVDDIFIFYLFIFGKAFCLQNLPAYKSILSDSFYSLSLSLAYIYIYIWIYIYI